MRLLALALVSLAPLANGQSIWTVKPDGTGDFLTVQEAVTAAAPDDILLIAPFTWGDITVAKPLTLLGDPDLPRPTFVELRFIGCDHFAMSHLAPEKLLVWNVTARSYVDDCAGKTASFSGDFDATISRCTFGPDVAQDNAVPGVLAYGGFTSFPYSRLRIVDCELTGGPGLAHFATGLGDVVGSGGPALKAEYADVWVSGSTLTGGAGQDSLGKLGKGGAAVKLFHSGAIDVRGSSFDTLTCGPNDPSAAGAPPIGLAIDTPLGDTVVSGVTLDGGVSAGVTFVAPRPYLEIAGTDGPGGVRRIDLYGPAGPSNLAVVGLSTAATYDPSFTAAMTAPLEIQLGQLFTTLPLVPLGQDVPASVSIPLPTSPSLAGFAVHAQGLELDGSGAWWLTNSTVVLLSF